jgi:aspartate/methionine/tyrosine aminotransferase
MTGWRLGWTLASERTTAMLAKVEEFMTSSAPAMIQQAGIVALRDGEPYVREVRERYAARRQLVVDALAGIPGVTLPDLRGAFYAFPHVDGMRDSTAFAKSLLQRTGVALAPGVAFGAGGEGHLRLCFASSEAVLEPALERLAAALRG